MSQWVYYRNKRIREITKGGLVMKAKEQILGFIQGWQMAIRHSGKNLDDNAIYQVLIAIESYIKYDEP